MEVTNGRPRVGTAGRSCCGYPGLEAPHIDRAVSILPRHEAPIGEQTTPMLSPLNQKIIVRSRPLRSRFAIAGDVDDGNHLGKELWIPAEPKLQQFHAPLRAP